MRFKILATLIILAAVGLIAGCHKPDSSIPPASVSSQPIVSTFEGRLGAAMGIQNGTERDAALVQVAKDSSNAGDVGTTRKALTKVENGLERDNATAASATNLAALKKTTEATAIAKTIENGQLRDTTLAIIAKNPGGG